MHKFIFAIFLCPVCFSLKAQSGQAIIRELSAINTSVANKSCSAGNAAAISNRAMNVFLADKTSYLSESSDLSLYTNYVTLNTTEGTLTVNHNFQKATGMDEPIKKLFSAGVSINVANEMVPPFLDKKFENGLGLLLGYKWLGKVKTHFADCVQTGNSFNQKQSMDALRIALLQSLTTEINKKEEAFNIVISGLDSTTFSGQKADTAKAIVLRYFYEDLQEEYTEKFVRQQAELLTKTRHFKRITTGWTGITAYIPILSPTYTVAPSFTIPFQKKHTYPLTIMLSHTRLWESTKTGRWFFTISGKAFLNNSKSSYHLLKTNLSQYQALGGIDTLPVTDLKNNKAYIGRYENFITPAINGRFVYFPPANSHIGFSFSFEQNFGTYHLLNSKIGLPVILINSKKIPAANFEFYVRFFDMNNTLETAKRNGSKTTVGVDVGIPLSRLMF